MSLIETIHLHNVKKIPWRGPGARHQTANEFAFTIGEVLNKGAEQLRSCGRVACAQMRGFALAPAGPTVVSSACAGLSMIPMIPKSTIPKWADFLDKIMRQSKVIEIAIDRTLSDLGLGRDTYLKTSVAVRSGMQRRITCRPIE